MTEVKTILIRLPNWLGDMVMASAFVEAVKRYYPNAEIDLIAKRGIDFLLDYFPSHNNAITFSKHEYEGLKGAHAFGEKIGKEKKYDLFFCLPDSLSAATMGAAINAKKSIGFKKKKNYISIFVFDLSRGSYAFAKLTVSFLSAEGSAWWLVLPGSGLGVFWGV